MPRFNPARIVFEDELAVPTSIEPENTPNTRMTADQVRHSIVEMRTWTNTLPSTITRN